MPRRRPPLPASAKWGEPQAAGKATVQATATSSRRYFRPGISETPVVISRHAGRHRRARRRNVSRRAVADDDDVVFGAHVGSSLPACSRTM